MDNIRSIFLTPARTMLTQIGMFISSALLLIIILIIGWLISKYIIKPAVTQILKLIKLDTLAKRIEFDTVLAKGGITVSLPEVIGVICYWIAILITFVVALDAVGFLIAANLLNQIVLFIPNIVAAIFILVVGMLVAVTLRNIVKTASSNAGMAQASLLSKITEVVVMVFAITMALGQLQIDTRIIEQTIAIIIGAIGLGFALALGLGCKDIVGKSVAGFIDRLKK